MSHAANIRNRSRSGHTQEPQKRRRIEGPTAKVNGVHATTNGILEDTNISARLVKDAKSTINRQAVESAAKVRNADAEEDAEMANGDSMLNGVDSEMSDEDEEDSDDDVDEDESEEQEIGGVEIPEVTEQSDLPATNGVLKKSRKVDSGDKNEAEADAGATPGEELAEPSFGEMLRANGSEPIDVDASHAESHPTSKTVIAGQEKRVLSIPNATSLGTVLTQALKTNDAELLESCFHVTELESIRATVERLPSVYATALLQKLSERMHKRPGRAGSLMVWVQWTVVAHGGYLASQPAAMRELQTLHQVVKQRASGLAPLLALKGKLDLLEAQLQLRRNIAARARARDRDAVQGTIYVEGQEKSSSEDDLPPVMGATSIMSTKPRARRQRNRNRNRRALTNGAHAQASDEDIEGDMPTTMPNGIDNDGFEDVEEDSEGSEDEDEDEDDLLDDEAEETDADSEDFSDDVEYDDVEELDEIPDSEEEEEEERPSKRSRAI